ncbi:uncharacterized protein LOC130757840 [Actinidia eriantha]|uniref:uncharacterized protein LOC130757840 n=1 Tax=Actinidia eriantha TaxID=165200 RepID=UPI002584FBE6|nr:uncharacterized protein LOC130757840 [Actinidia eriantha]
MAKTKSPKKNTKKPPQNQNQNAPNPEKPPSWEVLRSLLTCKHLQAQLQPPQKQQKHNEMQKPEQPTEENIKKCKKMTCSGLLCSNTKVMHRPEQSLSPPEDKKKRASMGTASINNNGSNSSRSLKAPLNELSGAIVSSSASTSNSSMLLSFGSSSNAGSLRGMPFRRFSGCYECRMVVDPVLGFSRDPSLRATICSCPQCGEIFMKAENLELHQAVRHAVSELGPEDTSKNIVEIIFQSSWLKKQSPICKIDRILKVQNTPKTIAKFEEYRDSVKAKSVKLPKKHPRCAADGNELLRFHSSAVACSLGLDGSSNLCNSIPNCSVCRIIKNGFRVSAGGKGVLTTATSGRAHDKADLAAEDRSDRRAMLVCRVIAGRVRKGLEGCVEAAEYDSVACAAGFYSNLDDLYVFHPRAILPCFVVLYRGF